MPRPIEALIHSGALANNIGRARAASPDARLWAVVKANAYGHGIERVFEALRDADGFALLDLAEAERVRALGWRGPILLLEGAFEPRDLPGEQVNGALTVGENIGDLGGLTIAHLAYRIHLGDDPAAAEEPDEHGLAGFQRLFFNWAYCWRTKRRKELALQFLATDPHSPPEFRANIVRNLTEFHDAFGTRPGDGLWLDPDDRVRIW